LNRASSSNASSSSQIFSAFSWPAIVEDEQKKLNLSKLIEKIASKKEGESDLWNSFFRDAIQKKARTQKLFTKEEMDGVLEMLSSKKILTVLSAGRQSKKIRFHGPRNVQDVFRELGIHE